MGAVWCVLAGLMLVDADDQQKIGYSVKAQVIRHYVAFFEFETTVGYKKRTLMDSSKYANWDRPDMYKALIEEISGPPDHENIHMFNYPTGLSRILCNCLFHVMGTLSSYMMMNWLIAAVQWTRGRVHLRDRLSRAR